ncbi:MULTISPECIES: hypothetical protein [unclassified Spirosoma]|uniref:hypothetical protein n=1 Tax=unclassified Spirosoma TaxID=2621999 RepID=UPI000968D544|nr:MULTISPECIES: hypothetical protein [unclassified Spirosoma]MBN8824301.1 hypothetical protein [Spirosoma sp.]OJW70227.1 MAG: hypothetical protein BGO59_26535 [Spirosoma sp. 48-14]
MPSFFQNPVDRKWLIILAIILLLFVFMGYCVWLYYSYHVKKLDHQKLILLPDSYPWSVVDVWVRLKETIQMT